MVQVKTIARVDDVNTQGMRPIQNQSTQARKEWEEHATHRGLLTVLRPAITDESVAAFVLAEGKCAPSQLGNNQQQPQQQPRPLPQTKKQSKKNMNMLSAFRLETASSATSHTTALLAVNSQQPHGGALTRSTSCPLL